MARDSIMYSWVIDKRKGMLESMRAGFKKTVVSDFLCQRQHLIPSVFPKEADFVIPSEWIIEKMVISDSEMYPQVAQAMNEFIQSQKQGIF